MRKLLVPGCIGNMLRLLYHMDCNTPYTKTTYATYAQRNLPFVTSVVKRSAWAVVPFYQERLSKSRAAR